MIGNILPMVLLPMLIWEKAVWNGSTDFLNKIEIPKEFTKEQFLVNPNKLLFMKLMGKMLGGKKKGEKAKPMGFEMTPEIMSMMGGFTVLRLLTMAGGMMDVKFTKEDLLALNKKLSRIGMPKPKKK
jgi:hypothetical protein